jgi:hypothetical protein
MFSSMTDPSRDLVSDVDLAVWADRRSDAPLGAGPELLLEGKLIASRRIWRHATVPGWRRCSRLMTGGSMSAWLTAGPRQHPLSRPARRRSSCSRTSHQRPAGLTQHRVGDPRLTASWPRCGPGSTPPPERCSHPPSSPPRSSACASPALNLRARHRRSAIDPSRGVACHRGFSAWMSAVADANEAWRGTRRMAGRSGLSPVGPSSIPHSLAGDMAQPYEQYSWPEAATS